MSSAYADPQTALGTCTLKYLYIAIACWYGSQQDVCI